jgi:hypothetical protein
VLSQLLPDVDAGHGSRSLGAGFREPSLLLDDAGIEVCIVEDLEEEGARALVGRHLESLVDSDTEGDMVLTVAKNCVGSLVGNGNSCEELLVVHETAVGMVKEIESWGELEVL